MSLALGSMRTRACPDLVREPVRAYARDTSAGQVSLPISGDAVAAGGASDVIATALTTSSVAETRISIRAAARSPFFFAIQFARCGRRLKRLIGARSHQSALARYGALRWESRPSFRC